MRSNEIVDKLLNYEVVGDDYSLFAIGCEKRIFFGKNKEGNIVFVMVSDSHRLRPSIQKTNSLVLHINARCNYTIDSKEETFASHILECLSMKTNDINAFVRLCLAFYNSGANRDEILLLFNSLKHLFDTTKKSIIEIEGFFSELYTIYYLEKNKILDLSTYWQKRDMMKFDFMIDCKKRIDVKSTTRDLRIHHFKHEQLQHEIYDIIIASVMLRVSNTGISLFDLIEYARMKYSSDYYRASIVEDKIYGYTDADLKNIVYDSEYLGQNIRFINARNVPKFSEQHPPSVSKAEYDSDISKSETISLEELKKWFEKTSQFC